MIILGIVLLVIGLLLHIGILFTLGIILAVIGAVLVVANAAGAGVGNRLHYW